MKWIPHGLAALALAAVAWAKDPYLQQWQLVALVLVLPVGLALSRVFRWPVVAMGSYLVLHALCYSQDAHGLKNVTVWLANSTLGLRQVLLLGGALAAGFVLRERTSLFSWAVPLAAGATLAGYPFLGFNTSMNASMLVAGLPFVARPLVPMTALLIASVVVFRQYGMTATGMLVLWGLLQLRGRAAWFASGVGPWLAALGISAAMLRVYYLGGLSTLTQARMDRPEMWGYAWNFFRENFNPLWGAGLSSFRNYGPLIGHMNKFQPWQHWFSLHSDWLELGFDLGLVGLALGVWLYADSVWRAEERTRQALILMGVAAIGYFPMSVPIMVAYAGWLVARVQAR